MRILFLSQGHFQNIHDMNIHDKKESECSSLWKEAYGQGNTDKELVNLHLAFITFSYNPTAKCILGSHLLDNDCFRLVLPHIRKLFLMFPFIAGGPSIHQMP